MKKLYQNNFKKFHCSDKIIHAVNENTDRNTDKIICAVNQSSDKIIHAIGVGDLQTHELLSNIAGLLNKINATLEQCQGPQ